MKDGGVLFISRAGSDAAIAEVVARTLEDAGYSVILQQWSFPNHSFIAQMHEALASGARVIALLSPDYLRSDGCAAEWLNVLAPDPLNRAGRLIVMRVAECQPLGLLAGLFYWDLVPIRNNLPLLTDVVRNAVRTDHRTSTVISGPYWRTPAPIVDPKAVRFTSSFTGRSRELGEVEHALWERGGRAVLHGLSGTGKSTLAREYARRYRERYVAIGWLAAQTNTGIIDGLIWLGSQFVRGLDQIDDRTAAARQALSMLSRLSTSKRPVLLIFDNLEERQLLDEWAPDGIHVVSTTRIANWGGHITRVRIHTWPADDAAEYVALESGRDDLTSADAATIADTLGCLPLAIAHAAAYLRSTITVSAARYLERLDERMKYAPTDAEYPKAVYATVQESVAKAEELRPGAAAVLCLAAFFAPDAVPEELFRQSIDLYPESLFPHLPLVSKLPLDLRSSVAGGTTDDAIGVLHRLSLIEFSTAARAFTVHRLVQSAARNLVGNAIVEWSWAAITVIDSVFPSVNFDTWATCERLVLHAGAALAALPADAEPPRAARIANRCGSYLNERAEYRQAESLFRRALAIDETAYGLHHWHVATDINNLASVLRAMNRLQEAEPLFRRALAIDETSYGPDHPEVAVVLNNLAGVLRAANRFDEAEAFYRRAVAIDEGWFGSDHADVATDLNNLANLLRATNRWAEAELLYRRALAIGEKNLGEHHPQIGFRLNNLAALLRLTHRLPEAERLYRRALSIEVTAYGDDHPEVAIVLNNLAELLTETNRMVEAEPLFRRSIAIVEVTYGPDHPSLAKRLNNLAVLLRQTNRLSEAEELHRRALSIDEVGCGLDHPEVATDLGNLAGLLRATGRLDEAEFLYRRALAIDEACYGCDHPEVATDLNSLAGLLRVTNRPVEAETLYRRALAIDENSFGPDHPKIAIRLCNLATVLNDTGHLAEAEPIMRRALAVDEAAYGSDHPSVATDLNNLAALLRKFERWTEAEAFYRRALIIDEAYYGPHHHEIAIILKNLSELLRTTDRVEEAELLYHRALGIDEAAASGN